MTIEKRIIDILKTFEAGLTYKNLLDQYKKEYNEELLWGNFAFFTRFWAFLAKHLNT